MHTSHYPRLEKRTSHPRKTTTYILHVVPITTHTHDRRKPIGKKKQKKRKEDKGKERKDSTSSWSPPKSFRIFSTTSSHLIPARPFVIERERGGGHEGIAVVVAVVAAVAVVVLFLDDLVVLVIIATVAAVAALT